MVESRQKCFSQWLQKEAITAQTYFLPFIQALLTSSAELRPLVLVIAEGVAAKWREAVCLGDICACA